MGCLYKIEFPNGKNYIGFSSHCAEKRAKQHFKDARFKPKTPFHKAIIKYGKENLKIKTLVVANDIEYLKEIEIKAIAAYKTILPFGYNSTKGGDGFSDWPEDMKERMSEFQKKLHRNPEHHKKCADATARAWQDPELRKRASNSAKKRWQDPEQKEKFSIISKNRWKNSRDKFVLSAKKRWQDPEQIKNRSESAKAKWQDPDYRKKISESQKKVWEERKNAIR